MKIIRVCTTNNIENAFYKVLRPLQYFRIPSKTFLSKGIMENKPYSKETAQALRSAFEALSVKYEEVEE